MSNPRLEALKAMLPTEPNDPTLRYMLANEYVKAGLPEDAINEINYYLTLKDDEGAVFRLLAQSLGKLGRNEEAIEAYRRGIDHAQRHGHPGMVEEFEMAIEDLA